jgi:hypothetical protein
MDLFRYSLLPVFLPVVAATTSERYSQERNKGNGVMYVYLLKKMVQLLCMCRICPHTYFEEY